MNKRITAIAILIFGWTLWGTAQQVDLYPYFPVPYTAEEWKGRVDLFGSEQSVSNSFTNKFINEIRNSGYLDEAMKNEQIAQLEAGVLTGNIRSVGAGGYFKGSRFFYYAGIEHQQVLDSRLDKQLVQLLLLGNKPFAGTTLEIGASDYSNIYFNRVGAGMGIELEQGELTHTFFGKLAFTSGQNYEDIQLDQASLYTHPDGDFLDVAVQAETHIGDTVWADVFTLNGLGASIDLSYTLQKEKGYYFSFTAKNLGFVSWNRRPYSASVDSNFHYEGISPDTTSSGDGVPDDYSYENLRDLLFKNPDASPFTTWLPMSLFMSGGKYFGGDRYYAGANLVYYPSLQANFAVELFATWNYRHRFQLTPIVSYNSYGRVHVGLSAGVKIGNHVFLRAGSAFLDSYFNPGSSVASGGFLRAVVVW